MSGEIVEMEMGSALKKLIEECIHQIAFEDAFP